MNNNVAIDHPAFIVWDGVAGNIIPTINFVNSGFTFRFKSELLEDTTFNFNFHDASDADPCIPGAAQPVPAIPFCDTPLPVTGQAFVTFPAGTGPGSYCTAALPCRNGEFISVAPAAGPTGEPEKVEIVIVFDGIRR